MVEALLPTTPRAQNHVDIAPVRAALLTNLSAVVNDPSRSARSAPLRRPAPPFREEHPRAAQREMAVDRIHDSSASGLSRATDRLSAPAEQGALHAVNAPHLHSPLDEGAAPSTRYLHAASASDRYYEVLGSTQNADSTVKRQLRHVLGDKVGGEQAASLHRWRQVRRHELSDISKRKLKQTQVLAFLNRQMAGRFKTTSKSLNDFNKASHAAARRPGYFQSSMRGLITQCESYGDLVGRQIQAVRDMRAQNAAIDHAGGARPLFGTGASSVPRNADSEVVSGPLSANVERPDAERLVGRAEMESTRTQLKSAINTLRDSVEAMRRGLKIAQDVGDGKGREDLGTPQGIRQKDVVGEHNVGEGGARRGHFRLEGETLAIGRLTTQLQVLQQGYDELGFL